MLELEKSRTGVTTLKFDGRYIHSKYDPIKESEKFVQGNLELINKPSIVLYGLGLGYIIDSIAKIMDYNAKLYVFENNIDIVNACKNVNEKVFEYKNVHIICGNNKEFYNKLSKCLEDAGDLIVHRPSLDTIKESNELLYNLLNDFSNMKQFMVLHNDIMIRSEENFDVNTKAGYKNIHILIDQYRKSCKKYIVTSAGPSLDNDLSLLKEYRDRFNIISVGSSLRTLVKYDIYPDIIVIVDTKEIIKKQFAGIDCSNINLCFEAYASRWAAESYKGPKYMFNDNSPNDVPIKNGGTVAVAAIDIAVNCGAEEIILLGQDLAFKNGKTHTSTFEETYGIKDENKNVDILKKVKGTDGGFVYTKQGYITFRNRIEALIRANNNVEFINCSSGAFINGALHMKFNEFIDKKIK